MAAYSLAQFGAGAQPVRWITSPKPPISTPNGTLSRPRRRRWSLPARGIKRAAPAPARQLSPLTRPIEIASSSADHQRTMPARPKLMLGR